MTYRALYELKFNQKWSTIELEKRFPRDQKKITTLALLELPLNLLKRLIKDEKQFSRMLNLRKNLFPSH